MPRVSKLIQPHLCMPWAEALQHWHGKAARAVAAVSAVAPNHVRTAPRVNAVEASP